MLNNPYRGAGILFSHRNGSGELEVLLAKRRIGQWWSISGGKVKTAEGEDYWGAALRETEEEFGALPEDVRFSVRDRKPRKFVCKVPGFFWETYLVELRRKPDESQFPCRGTRDYHREFSEHRWFSLAMDRRPDRLYPLLFPALLWLDWGAARKWILPLPGFKLGTKT